VDGDGGPWQIMDDPTKRSSDRELHKALLSSAFSYSPTGARRVRLTLLPTRRARC
jgi:hypothetical protein